MIKLPTEQELKDSLRITTDGVNLVEVIKPIYYEIYGAVYVLPVGFKSDGPSNPFLKNRLTYKVLVFGLLHDYGYRTQFNPHRSHWDNLALEILPITADKYTAYTHYIPLRAVGGIAWRNNKKKLEKYPEAKQLRNEYICAKLNIL